MIMSTKNNPSFYVIATVARSFDSYHDSNQIPHLIFSTFYTNSDKLDKIYSLGIDQKIIIRIIDSPGADIESKLHNPKTIEFIIPNYILFNWGANKLGLKSFFEILMNYGKKENINIYNLFSSILFVFEDLNWSNIRLLFSGLKVSASGGSISQRHLLSTSEYLLSRYLFIMGYTLADVNYSKQLSKSVNEIGIVANRNYELSRDLLINIMHKEYHNEFLAIINYRKKLNMEIIEANNTLLKFNKRIQLKGSEKELYLSRLPLEYQPKNLEKTIEKLKNDLLALDSNEAFVKKEVDSLNLLSDSELLNKYYKEFHNNKFYLNQMTFEKNLLKFLKQPYTGFSKFTGKRFYSTSCRQLTNNSLLFYNNHRSEVKLFRGTFTITTKIRQTRSISSQNSEVSYELLKLLYSKDTKENIQKNIETYLITKQNNLLLSQQSSVKTNSFTASPVMNYNSKLNFKLINTKLFQLLLENKNYLEKLYSNYIAVSNSDKQNLIIVLSTVGFEYISNILFGRLLSIISNNHRTNSFTLFTNIAYDLGKDLVNRYNYINYSLESSKYDSFSEFKKVNTDSPKIMSTDDATYFVELGSILIGWLIELKLIKTKVVIISKQEKRNILLLDNKLNKVISPEQIHKNILNLPKKIPMIVEPKKYIGSEGSIQLGGYLLNDILYTEPLFIEKYSLVEKSELSENNKIYKMVDNLNSVSFAINEEVLDFILNNYKKYNLIIDPDFKHPLELKAKLTLQEKRDLESFLSKQKLENEILNLASIFKNCSEIYLPVRLDYRGRIYCNVEYLNYQGIELAKALLKFSKGEKVLLSDTVSINYLKIFGANCFGFDKLSFYERIKWIDENEEGIINFENGNLIEKASSKLLFISFCIEYNKYLKALNNNEGYFITHLPIQLDATCNGFQHLSLLLSDINLAKQVNLTSSDWKQIPDDFYSSLSLSCKIYFESELESNKNLTPETKESYKRLLKLEFKNHRKLVKKTIMTIPYNSTKYANILDMKSDFLKKGNIYTHLHDANFSLEEIDFKIMCNTLYFCLYRDYPKLEKLLNYFKDIARISNKLGISIPWTLPSGLTVKQKFFGTKKVKFKPFIYTKDLLTLNILDKNKFNTRKQIRALMPNLVHSLDAVNLALLIDNFFKEDKFKNFYSVHDCFAVTCNNVSLIADLLKLSYYNIYITDHFLLKFDSNFKKFIISQFGPNSYSEKTNLITVINDEGETIKLNYPDVHKVFKPQVLEELLNSSYIIN